jgi:hypothetical protein
MRGALVPAIVLLVAVPGRTVERRAPAFVIHEIATGLRGGYQVVVVDLNRDRKPDLIAVASNLPELVWYENPGWQRHVIAAGLTGMINVAAADLDGDGIPELALAHGFATTPGSSTGNVSLLTHGADPTQPWTMREIDRVPTAHRLRWFTPPAGAGAERWLINAPLVGATAQAPEYRGATPIYVYRPPDWKRELLSDAEQGVVHAIEPVRWDDATGVVMLSAGFLGLHRYQFSAGTWTRTTLADGDPAAWPNGGSSDIAVGRLGADRFLAAIEPWHGKQIVVYRTAPSGWQRHVVDSTLTDGHALLAVDLDGDGRDEIVAGERGGTRTVRVLRANAASDAWVATPLDAGGMAAAGCAAADLNSDGRIDLVCIGTATANLKWYENAGS